MVFDKTRYPFGQALPHLPGLVDLVRIIIIDEHFVQNSVQTPSPYKIKLLAAACIAFHKRVWIVLASPRSLVRSFARPPAQCRPHLPKTIDLFWSATLATLPLPYLTWRKCYFIDLCFSPSLSSFTKATFICLTLLYIAFSIISTRQTCISG